MTSFARPSLCYNISHSLQYNNFILSGIPHVIHVVHFRWVRCIDSLCGWNVNKEGSASEAEEGEEANSRDCAG